MTVIISVKVGRDFRVTLPKEVRDMLQLNEGDEIVFYTMERIIKRVCMRKA